MFTSRIEQQLTLLSRRVHSLPSPPGSGETELERSAYRILSRLADEGQQRLGTLASGFALDPSTITRQVQALESAGLVRRGHDPADRRAALLQLTEAGTQALEETRSERCRYLERALHGWTANERRQFAALLTKFNETVAALALEHADT